MCAFSPSRASVSYTHLVGRQVGLYAKQEVVAKLRPSVIKGLRVAKLTKRWIFACSGIVFYLSINICGYKVASLCCTVVVKEVISVSYVLGLIVSVDGLKQGRFLLRCKI